MTAITTCNERGQLVATLYGKAVNAYSLAGELCRMTGAAGAIIGGFLTLSTLASDNFGAVLMMSGFTGFLAFAGAPVAALGSIATQHKRATRLLELQVQEALHRP